MKEHKLSIDSPNYQINQREELRPSALIVHPTTPSTQLQHRQSLSTTSMPTDHHQLEPSFSTSNLTLPSTNPIPKSDSFLLENHPTQNQNQKLPLPQRFSRAVKREIDDFKLAVREAASFIKHNDWKLTFKQMFRRKYWGWWFLLIVVLVLSTLLSSYHTKIALYIKPYQVQIRKAPCAWLIPTVLLIIVSFPPLFGHELIILVAGMIWGLWIGFAIACAGTFLGEIATFFAFKHMIRHKSEKIESRSVTYASLAKLMREGGLTMVILVRASAIPGHVCTAMQATIGVEFWVFTVACFVTLPKQFALVYVGVMLGDPNLNRNDPLDIEEPSNHDKEARSHHVISAVVFLVTAFFTIISAYIVWMRMRRLRPAVQEEFARKNLPLHQPDASAPVSEKASHLASHPYYHSSSLNS